MGGRLSPYDDFDNPTYENKINEQLWNPVFSPPNFVNQDNGKVFLSVLNGSDAHTATLFATQKMDPSKHNFLEARMLLSSDSSDANGETGLAIILEDSNGEKLHALCVIGGSLTRTWCEAWGRTDRAEYVSEMNPTNYDIWHTYRIEIDPEINIVYYIDGEKIGSYTPQDADELKNNEFIVRLEVWSPERLGIEGVFDDIWIGQYK
jgi:hypothetical protein